MSLVVFGAVLAVKKNVDGESAIMRKWKLLDHLLRNWSKKRLKKTFVLHFASLATFIGSVGHMFFKSKKRGESKFG